MIEDTICKKRIPNYKEHILQSNDIEFLRISLLQHMELNNKLHRRVQEHESIATQWLIDKENLQSEIKRSENAYNNNQRYIDDIWDMILSLPFPLWIWLRRKLQQIHRYKSCY